MAEHMQAVNGIWVRHETDGISVFLCRSQKFFVVEKIIIKNGSIRFPEILFQAAILLWHRFLRKGFCAR